MHTSDAIALMSALAHPTRLRCYAVLTEKGSCTAGELAEGLGVPKNLLSSHMAILNQAGLVSSVRSGRSVTYTPERGRLKELARRLDELSSSSTKYA